MRHPTIIHNCLYACSIKTLYTILSSTEDPGRHYLNLIENKCVLIGAIEKKVDSTSPASKLEKMVLDYRFFLTNESSTWAILFANVDYTRKFSRKIEQVT